MRIALLHPYLGNLLVETELARRISLAAAILGWQAREVASSVEINQFAPDLVISLHFRTPKLTKHPTYGCFWNPSAFFEGDSQFTPVVMQLPKPADQEGIPFDGVSLLNRAPPIGGGHVFTLGRVLSGASSPHANLEIVASGVITLCLSIASVVINKDEKYSVHFSM